MSAITPAQGHNVVTSENETPSLSLGRFRDYLIFLAREKLGVSPHSHLEASDLVQQTLLEAHRKEDQFRGTNEAELAGWLRQLLAYNLADALRALGRAKRDVSRERTLESDLDASSARLGDWLVADQSSPSQCVERHEQAVRLASALAALPPAQREALVLRHFHGRSLAEISQRLDRSPSAVAGLLKRGAQTLRTMLQDSE